MPHDSVLYKSIIDIDIDIRVRPPGLLPSIRVKPAGFSTTGNPAAANARATSPTKSFNVWMSG